MLYFKLDRLMDQRKLSINKVSSETKISRPALTAMYNNESKGVQFETLEKLMDYFNVSLDQLIGEKDDQTVFKFKNLILERANYNLTKESFLVEVEGKNEDLNPGEAIVFEGNISVKGIYTDPFSFLVTPVSSNDETNRIISLRILFYRNEKKQDLEDIAFFINELNNDSLKKLLHGILDSWHRVYKLIDDSISNKVPNLKNGLILVSLDTIDKKLSSVFPVEIKSSITNDKYFSFDLLSQIERPKINERVNIDFVVREIQD